MKKKRIVLHFPKELVDKPIIYRLIKDFDLSFNIMKAQVDPNQEGLMVLELSGNDEAYKKGIAYLKDTGVGLQLLSQDVLMNKDKCVDCSVCVPLCPTQALVKNLENYEVEFNKDKCIACGICVHACPYQAIKISF